MIQFIKKFNSVKMIYVNAEQDPRLIIIEPNRHREVFNAIKNVLHKVQYA